jgi:flagellar basal-body rod modification protein FlgD
MIDAMTSATSATSASSTRSLAASFDNFLTLLTTQLQNQDPLSPMDTEAFTQQIVQFTAVEQAIKTNTHLDQLIALTRSSRQSEASSWLGKVVEAKAGTIDVPATGEVAIRIQADGPIASGVVKVVGSAGQTLFSAELRPGTDEQTLAWNGRDALGTRVAPGTYRVLVEAKNAQGGPLAASALTRGTVDAVELGGSELQLRVGGALVPLSAVASVRTATIQS